MTVQDIIKKHISEPFYPMMELAFSGSLSASPIAEQVFAAANPSEEVIQATKETLGMPATIMVLLTFFQGNPDASKAMAKELVDSKLLSEKESEFLAFFVKTAGGSNGN